MGEGMREEREREQKERERDQDLERPQRVLLGEIVVLCVVCEIASKVGIAKGSVL